ncbi:hypothetical protein C8Q76DRAFT_618591 [Earliella scabrosa]|nr:hypothetical protein C8Q76DRAFT_618591 [Earliella scabrosa]
MPKSTKKKKDKAADFTKAKLKLGKGKQTPSNAVDTSFKARSIALPTQSIALEKITDAPSTKRRLTFDALIAHTKHYNASTRRDAVLGLRELLEVHSELISAQLTTLINNCVRLIGDEDANVRKALLSFFGWLFHQVPHDELIPHSPVLLLFTTSAQTHIFPEIRIDAVRFLDIFLDHIPEVVTEGWTNAGSGSHGRRVLEGYLGILSAGTTFGEGGDTGPVQATSTASVILSPVSKVVVLKSLASFLSQAIPFAWRSREPQGTSGPTLTTPTWYLSSSFASTSAFNCFDALLVPTLTQTDTGPSWHWSQELDGSEGEDFAGSYSLADAPCSAELSVQDLSDVSTLIAAIQEEGRSGLGTDAEVSCNLARTLHSTLVATFLDCAPSVFSPSTTPPETELQMVLVVCQLCRSLYGRILQDSAEVLEDLQTILSYLSPYFPFTSSGPSTMRRDIKAEQAFQDLNLIFCELSSFIVLASQRSGAAQLRSKRIQRGGSRRPPKPHAAVSIQTRQIERVSEYIVQLLQGRPPSSGGQSSLPRPITPQAYVALLPTIWSLMNHGSSDQEDSPSIFSVVVEHAIKASSTSAVKRHTIDFLGRLILLDNEAEYLGAFRAGQSQEQDAKLREWILQMPKTLWELGSSHVATSETIVRLLLRLCQRKSRLLQPETYSALRSRLIPLFSIVHPTRGKLPGPYTKLPADAHLRRLVLDCVASIGHTFRATGGGDNLESVVSDVVRDTNEGEYWAGIQCYAR